MGGRHELEGTRILVTGATGSLGRAVLSTLLERGAAVTGTYVVAEEREQVAAKLPEDSRLTLLEADLLDPGACEAAVEAAAAGDSLDALACLAGGFAAGPTVDEAAGEGLERMLDLNLHTAWNACAAALPALERADGSLALVGARAALEPFSGGAAYAVSKASVLALVRAIDAEWGQRGVRANAVLPGVIDTPANREAMPGADPGEWTSPDAIARAVAFLLSAESAAVRGAWLPVHGVA